MIRSLCAAAIVAALPALASAAPIGGYRDDLANHWPVNRYFNRGGSVQTYVRDVMVHNSAVTAAHMRGEHPVTHIGGVCWSACTLRLAYTDACIESDANLGFHQPLQGESSFMPGTWSMAPASDLIDANGVRISPARAFTLTFRNYGKPKLANWLEHNGLLSDPRMAYRTGAMVAAASGVPLCR